jgi:TatD DNase family protein
LVDSHCHIDFPELLPRITEVRENMRSHGVTHALCVAVNLEDLPRVLALSEQFENIYASVGVHPDHEGGAEPTPDELVRLARHPKVVAIGETGLDYYRHPERASTQQARFRAHLSAARQTRKPVIIHTRSAAEDTLRLMAEEGAGDVGGVMHCFTETWDVARRALDLGFYVSFSGIVTFKNAGDLREVARRVPDDRLLIETDSPYLAPVPHRGKTNEPAFVRFVAAQIAELRGVTEDTIAEITQRNFFRLFGDARRDGAAA